MLIANKCRGGGRNHPLAWRLIEGYGIYLYKGGTQGASNTGREPPAAQKDSKICAITAAMKYGTGLNYFSHQFRGENRFFDVGIAEPHAVTFAGGLAANGMLPVFAVYSSFLQRSYDQILHDLSIVLSLSE